MTILMTDEDVARFIAPDPGAVVRLIREAVRAAEHGSLLGGPRRVLDLGSGAMTVTPGVLDDRVWGYRIYDSIPHPSGGRGDHVTVVADQPTGKVRAIHVGRKLGEHRTGAIGGVAVDLLARRDATRVGVIGVGRQAWTQVWAITAVREGATFAVYSRDAQARTAFASRIGRELGATAFAVESPEEAVREKDVLVTATSSTSPVFDADWLSPGTHVNAVGPKSVAGHELPFELVERADVLVTDSTAQCRAYDPPFLLPGNPGTAYPVSLGAVDLGTAPGRGASGDVTVYISTGLAGTEVVLAEGLAKFLASERYR